MPELNYRTKLKRKIQTVLKANEPFEFGKFTGFLKPDMTIFFGGREYCKCKSIDQAIDIILYYQ